MGKKGRKKEREGGKPGWKLFGVRSWLKSTLRTSRRFSFSSREKRKRGGEEREEAGKK